MSLNDMKMAHQGVDVHPGVANPTSASNNSNPLATNEVKKTTPTESGRPWLGMPGQNREAGVVEARPGIIESTQLEPLEKPGRKPAPARDVIEGQPGIIESTRLDPLDKTDTAKKGAVSSAADAIKSAYQTVKDTALSKD